MQKEELGREDEDDEYCGSGLAWLGSHGLGPAVNGLIGEFGVGRRELHTAR
jgi:hypothetical protein